MKKTSIISILLLALTFSLTAQPPLSPVPAVATTSGSADISISSGPASDMIFITNNGGGQLEIGLYDAFGNKVLSKKLKGATEKIPASQLAIGTYTVLISSNGKMLRSQRIQID